MLFWFRKLGFGRSGTTTGIGHAEALREAMERRDGEQVESVIRAAFQRNQEAEIASQMGRLCAADWHCMHLDAVGLLQKQGEVHDIPVLEQMAGSAFPYLTYDETFALARRSTWAIADIGGSEALQALERIAKLDNPLIAGYAKKRLSAWTAESSRKRN